MSTEEIRDDVREALRLWVDHELTRVVAASQQLSDERATAQDLKPVLDGKEGIIDRLQSLYDRCRERFPKRRSGRQNRPLPGVPARTDT